MTPPVVAPSEDAPTESTSRYPRLDLDQLDNLVRAIDPKAQRRGGIWALAYEGVALNVVTDEEADRMRIVASVAKVDNVLPEHVFAAMMANFHTALDARYAIGQGVLFSTFIHRLSTLHPADFASGVRQTATLAVNFGTTYSSGEMVFGGR